MTTEAERNPFDGTSRKTPTWVRRTTLDGFPLAAKAPEERTMRIKLSVDYTVSLDGIHQTSFAAGQEAEIPERIAAVLLEDGRANLPEPAQAEAKREGDGGAKAGKK